MQAIPSDPTNSELKMTNENHDDSPTPPPPYRNVMDKLKNDNHFSTLPPSYTDINSPAVVYINNYPGPPLSDGVVQITTAHTQSSAPNLPQENILSRKMRICLVINGIITICLGVIAVGLQIGLLASHSIVYYYYGFWAGALIISIGISTIMFNNRYRGYNISKYFRSFICQSVLVAVILGFGFIIIFTDTCDNEQSEDDGDDDACKHSYKVLNRLLITVIALTLAQSIFNTLMIGCLKRRNSNHSNGISA